MSNPVPGWVGVLSPGAWIAGAIFGSDDLSQVHKALPIYLAIQDGSPRPLFEASQLAAEHSRKQDTFADNADKLRKLLNDAWKGESAEKAEKKIKKLSESARETSKSLDKNSKSYDSQGRAFDDIKHKMKPMDNPPPEGSGFLDRLAPWDTDAEKAVQRNQEAAQHNLDLYDKYSQTSKSNAESLTEKYGHAGNPGSQTTTPPDDREKTPNEKERPYTPPGTNDRQAQEEARRRQEEAQRRAEEQRRQMEAKRRRQEEEARRRQEEAQRRAEEQRRQMEAERRRQEEEARRRQQEAQRRAEEQRRQMEEEARRHQQEAAERARRAREELAGSSFTPSSPKLGSTSASSFSPSDFAGSGTGAGGLGAGAFGSGSGSGSAADGGRASGAFAGGGAPGGAGGAAAAARGAGMGGMRGGMGMGGMMGGAGAAGGKGDDKEHKRKFQATEDPNKLFGSDEKSVPPVIGEK